MKSLKVFLNLIICTKYAHVDLHLKVGILVLLVVKAYSLLVGFVDPIE